MNKVQVYEQRVTIPTYRTGALEKNPLFIEKRAYQGSTGKVYPVPMRRETASRAPCRCDASPAVCGGKGVFAFKPDSPRLCASARDDQSPWRTRRSASLPRFGIFVTAAAALQNARKRRRNRVEGYP